MNTQPRPLLVVIVGPAAVGKMTVGQELSRRTGFPLYHAHRLSDFLTDFFPFGSRSYKRLAHEFNRMLFEEAVASKLALIWTWAWAFDRPETAAEIAEFSRPWIEAGGAIYWVELAAPLDVRLERNRTENRRAHKKVEWATDEVLRQLDSTARWHSAGEFPPGIPRLRIETVGMTAAEVADLVCEAFPMLGGDDD